jgi:hypothetical protein
LQAVPTVLGRELVPESLRLVTANVAECATDAEMASSARRKRMVFMALKERGGWQSIQNAKAVNHSACRNGWKTDMRGGLGESVDSG